MAAQIISLMGVHTASLLVLLMAVQIMSLMAVHAVYFVFSWRLRTWCP